MIFNTIQRLTSYEIIKKIIYDFVQTLMKVNCKIIIHFLQPVWFKFVTISQETSVMNYSLDLHVYRFSMNYAWLSYYKEHNVNIEGETRVN